MENEDARLQIFSPFLFLCSLAQAMSHWCPIIIIKTGRTRVNLCPMHTLCLVRIQHDKCRIHAFQLIRFFFVLCFLFFLNAHALQVPSALGRIGTFFLFFYFFYNKNKKRGLYIWQHGPVIVHRRVRLCLDPRFSSTFAFTFSKLLGPTLQNVETGAGLGET